MSAAIAGLARERLYPGGVPPLPVWLYAGLALALFRVGALTCRAGHVRTVANTYVDARGAASCRECRADCERRYEERSRTG